MHNHPTQPGNTRPAKGEPCMPELTAHDALEAFERTSLEKFRLAADAILKLAEDDLLPSPLESELYIFRDRVDRVLLLPT